jgi:hypothetical protein
VGLELGWDFQHISISVVSSRHYPSNCETSFPSIIMWRNSTQFDLACERNHPETVRLEEERFEAMTRKGCSWKGLFLQFKVAVKYQMYRFLFVSVSSIRINRAHILSYITKCFTVVASSYVLYLGDSGLEFRLLHFLSQLILFVAFLIIFRKFWCCTCKMLILPPSKSLSAYNP